MNNAKYIFFLFIADIIILLLCCPTVVKSLSLQKKDLDHPIVKKSVKVLPGSEALQSLLLERGNLQ